MKVFDISFSPTGGTSKVSEMLADGLGEEIVCVDLTDPNLALDLLKICENDTIVISVPSYGGRVPITAVDRISKLKGNGARSVIVCVYGNRAYEDTLVELFDRVSDAGFKVIAAVAAIAEHSIARKYAVGRPDELDKNILEMFAQQIKDKLLSGDLSEPRVPGNRPYKERGSSVVPIAGSECVSCGICAEKCPVQAIDIEDNKKTDIEKCISCMRCVKICPHSARGIQPEILAAIEQRLEKVCSDRKECELYI